MLYLCSVTHETYMRRCLQLAQIGLRKAAPNPSVGAVLVHDNQIIGEGYTSPYGGPHGEVNCINDCKKRLGEIPANSSLYVSLEPCSHFGKTPPCSDLIIKENIQSVIVACTDVNPLVAGKGIEKLRSAGIKVIEHVLKEEASVLNRAFFHFHEKKRPFITLKWAQTAQGFFAPTLDQQFWITNQKSKLFVHHLRSEHMAILVGSKTTQIDNPQLTTRLIAGQNPLRVLLLGHEPAPVESMLLTDEEPTLVFCFKAFSLPANKTNILLDENKEVLPQIMQALYKRNILSLMVEGGAFTLQEFIDANLWDEAYILTGQQEMNRGKLAPSIGANPKKSFEFFGDKVKFYKNLSNDLVTA